MSIPPIAGIAGLSNLTGSNGVNGSNGAPAAGFGDAMARGLQQVSDLEHRADAMAVDIATGGPTKVHELMIATTESALAVDMLVQVRDKALDAYQEIMRMQL
jgi:flagellar hook-basal body complex protein FliE